MLTEREKLILQTIIDNFVETAHPIGSRALSKNADINLSAATIRNVMADLEELELLEKTHTSSGRIPSEKGYRYYVDHLITPTLNHKGLTVIRHMIQDNLIELEQIVQLSVDVLSQLTNYTTIMLGPNETETKLKQVQIVPVSANMAVAILITDAGHVEHKSFPVPTVINVRDLEKVVNILNERLVGVPISQLTQKLETEVYRLMKKHIKNYEIMYEYLKSVVTYDEPVKLYVSGQTNLLTQPEFNDVEKIYEFFTFLEDEEEVINLLLTNDSGGIKVKIGSENKVDAVKDFTLITTSYHLHSGQRGTIGIIGPTRMKYREALTLLNALSNELTEIFNDSKSS